MSTSFADRYTFAKLLKFTIPTMITLIFTSIYNVVDGFFISNYVGKAPFSAVNFITPFLLMLAAIGFMFGTGGSALISKTFGERREEEGKKIFSLIVYTSLILGLLMAVFGFLFLKPIAMILGAEGSLLENSIAYGRIFILSLPAFVVQFAFQSLFSTAGKPKLYLYITITSGVTNIVLDAVFIILFGWGLEGAAIASVISICIGGFFPLCYFSLPNSSFLRLCKTSVNWRALFKVCTNGSSELLSSISMSIVSMLYNRQLLKYAGADGVASYGVLMYVGFVFASIFIGYSVGASPIIGYQYGAKNQVELKNVFKKSIILIGCFSILMFLSSMALSIPLSSIFVGYDKKLFDMTVRAFTIFFFFVSFCGIFNFFIRIFYSIK